MKRKNLTIQKWHESDKLRSVAATLAAVSFLLPFVWNLCTEQENAVLYFPALVASITILGGSWKLYSAGRWITCIAGSLAGLVLAIWYFDFETLAMQVKIGLVATMGLFFLAVIARLLLEPKKPGLEKCTICIAAHIEH